MNIGLDYDGVCTADPWTFYNIARLLKAAGHSVYIVTMRYIEECQNIPKELLDVVDGLVCTNRMAKEPHMKSLGIRINVWIDDTPKAVHMDAKQIWGTVSPKGTVIDVVHTPDYHTEPQNRTRVLDLDREHGAMALGQGPEHPSDGHHGQIGHPGVCP